MLPAGQLTPAERPKAPKWSHQATGLALEEGLGGSNPFVNDPAYMVRAELFAMLIWLASVMSQQGQMELFADLQ